MPKLAPKTLYNKYFKDITKKQAREGLKSLKGVRKLISKPEHWMQGGWEGHPEDEEGYLDTSITRYCLMGAVEVVDGPGEEIADRVMLACIGEPWEPWYDYDVEVPQKLVFDTDSHEGIDCQAIMEFNDREYIKHKDILKLLDKAIATTEKLIEVAPSKLPKK